MMAAKAIAPRGAAAKMREISRFRTEFTNTIYDVLVGRGWADAAQTDEPAAWDLMWADKTWIKETLPRLSLQDHQRVNHFPNFYELTRKDNLAKNLRKTRRQLERDGKHEEAAKYNFFPQTYLLPAEYPLFIEEFKRSPGFYIMKPIGKSQGKGIFLFNKLAQISDWRQGRESSAENYVVQKYLHNPYLVGGKKFDCRIYCLCLSYSPLVMYLYRSGFARFSFHRYSVDARDMGNSFIHLTNVAVQKTSENYDPDNGCKWDLRALRLHLVRRHGPEAVDRGFQEVQQAIVLSLQAVQRVMVADRHCFELYGFDILFDEQLKPYVLEVNSSPSMSAENGPDRLLKSVLLNDTLDAVQYYARRKSGEPLEPVLGGFDLIHNAGWSRTTSGLGFYTPGVHGPKVPRRSSTPEDEE